jgi:outer membrane protein insertion porin family
MEIRVLTAQKPASIVLILCLFLPVMLWAQQGSVRVLGVSIEGNSLVDEGLIRANSGLVVGRTITGDDIQLAIRQLWQLNLFSSVDIFLEEQVATGGYFLIKVREYPRINTVHVTGNHNVKEDKILEKVDLYPGQVISPRKVFDIRKNLLQLYFEKGYTLAEVDCQPTDPDSSNRIDLHVSIQEGKKVKIKQITFTGNENFSDKKLRSKLKKTKQKSLFRSGNFDQDKYKDDKDLLVEFYRQEGFRDAQVLDDSIHYSEDRRRMFIQIDVYEGPKYVFGDVEFQGNQLFGDEELRQELEFATGDVYSQKRFDATQERIGNLYYNKGYIYSQVTPTQIPVGENQVNIRYDIVEGNEFKVRRINFEGNTKTHEKVLRREFVLYPGDTFDVSKLRRSIRDVTILNYFANIVPDVQRVNDREVDLYVEVEEKSTDQANLSAGYSERDGFVGSVGFSLNNFSLTNPLRGGAGQQFNFDWNFGRVYRSFSIGFTEPWLFSTPTLLGVSFYDSRRGGENYGFDEDLIGGTLRIGRRFRWPDDYFRGDWVYRLEKVEYSNFTESFKASNPRNIEEDVPRLSSSLTQIITRDSRDNPEFPTTGSVNSYRIEVAGGPFGGDDQFHKHVFTSEWYNPVVWKLVLYTRMEMGFLDGLTSDSDDIPYIEHFFMGGSGLSLGSGLRGYDEREVGPQSAGYAVGGKTLFKQTAELRFPIVTNPTIFGLAFAEAGNTWEYFSETSLFDLKRSAGLGIRLFMPFIGMIGLDYGYGFDYIDATGRRHGEWVPHFQFGRGF